MPQDVRRGIGFHGLRSLLAASSIEVEGCARGVARAGLADRIALAALCAELGRAAPESFRNDRISAIGLGLTMTRWAAEPYHRQPARGP